MNHCDQSMWLDIRCCCKQRLRVRSRRLATRVRCNACKGVLRIPGAREARLEVEALAVLPPSTRDEAEAVATTIAYGLLFLVGNTGLAFSVLGFGLGAAAVFGLLTALVESWQVFRVEQSRQAQISLGRKKHRTPIEPRPLMPMPLPAHSS